jgi:hypothetical protein
MDIRQLPSSIQALIAGLIKPEPQPVKRLPRKNKHTLKRLLACADTMEKDGILATAGYIPPPRGESVQALWNRHGWIPPREGLKLEPAKVEPEIISEVVALKRKARS